MKTLRHCVIFLFLYLAIVFASQCIGQTFSMRIDLCGLYCTAAICGLRRTEAVIAMLFLGFWLDALQPDVRLFGLQALLLSAPAFACHKRSLKVIFEARSRILGVFIQFILQTFWLLCTFAVKHIPVHYVKFYIPSFLCSAVLTAILTPPLLRFQRKFLAYAGVI